MKGKCKEDKRGELTTQQLVVIIVLIVSFAVILFFIFSLNLGETTNKQICHNSVIMKEKSKIGGTLDCKTTYVCISGGKDCEGKFDNKIEVDLSDEEKTKRQIMKAIADEMADCWWMFGEGKVDYAGSMLDEIKGNVLCARCSTIEFDSSIKNSGLNEISYKEFYEHLANKKKDSGTYSRYLYNADVVEGLFDEEYLMKEIGFEEDYVILTGIGKEGYLKKVGLFIITPLAAWLDHFIFKDEDKKIKGEYLPVSIVEDSKKGYEEFDCKSFLTKS